jgi:valyl-tRNA synthetase
LWQRLGLSVDWRYSYRTIDVRSRRAAQQAFLELVKQGRAYRQLAPTLWCPECQTAIAQAELDDMERESEYVTLPFQEVGGERSLLVATTRPELLSACVAVFVHPQDARWAALIGATVETPFYGQRVPVLADEGADPAKGAGAVMCCTFGDQTDMAWWRRYNLPLREAIDRQGRMTALAGPLTGLPLAAARQQVKMLLDERGLVLGREATRQSVRVHERCDTPVEIVVSAQWFVRVLEHKEALLQIGQAVRWHPEHMQARYRAWVENLSWDWAISRQRTFGVPFPAWTCAQCGAVMLAEPEDLPLDPLVQQPRRACACGGQKFIPEQDVMDTWATSSLSPQIVGRALDEPELYRRVFPFHLRPQAHEIIRTWAFYTLVQSHFHTGQLPWSDVLISGWGLAGEGMGKISKSRGGGPMAPMEMLERTSADGLRYWAASSAPGRDSVINPEKIQMGGRLALKLWNVARFSQPFLEEAWQVHLPLQLSPADRWILACTQRVIRRVSEAFEAYDYANAKAETEGFFWSELADNYLEMAKQRLYAREHALHGAACFALREALAAATKLFAPLMPFVTDAIYRELFAAHEERTSVHVADWPTPDERLTDPDAERWGATLVGVASAVRRYKSEHGLGLATTLGTLWLACADPALAAWLGAAVPDLLSVTRASQLQVAPDLPAGVEELPSTCEVRVGLG